MKIGRRKRNIILSIVLCVILAVWTVWGNTALMVNTVAISSSRIPAAFSDFRIAQASDLHNAEFGKNNAELLKLLSENRGYRTGVGRHFPKNIALQSEKPSR